MSPCDIQMTMSPNNKTVIVAIDDSDYAEYAFDCKYTSRKVFQSYIIMLISYFILFIYSYAKTKGNTLVHM